MFISLTLIYGVLWFGSMVIAAIIAKEYIGYLDDHVIALCMIWPIWLVGLLLIRLVQKYTPWLE